MTCFEDGRWQVLGDLTKTTADLSSSIEQTADSIESTVGAKIAQTTRNLLMGCVGKEFSTVPWLSDNDVSDGLWRPYHSETTLTATTDGIRADHAGTANGGIAIPLVADGCISAGETLTLSFEYRTNRAPFGSLYVLNAATPNVNQGTPAELVADGEWHAFEHTWTAKGNAQVPRALLISYYRQAGAWIEIRDGSCLLTRGESYTKSSTFKQTVDGMDGRITATEDGLAVQETLIRQYAGGVLVCKVGESVGALVNASGSFDVVSVTWSDNTPTVTGTLSTFASNLVELGKGNTSAEIQFCDNTGNISVKPNYKGNQAIAMGADNTTIQADEDVYVAAGTEWGQYVLVSELSKMVELHAATSSTAMGNVRVSSSGIGIDYQSGLATGAGISMFDITPSSGDPYPHMEIMSSGDIDLNAGKGVRILGPNVEGTAIRGVYFGTKILNPNNSQTMTLFTAAECQSMFGRALSQTKDVIIVQNGDTGAYGGQITGGTNASGALTATINPTKSGPIRYQYIVILGA